jgi:hypothetical protein
VLVEHHGAWLTGHVLWSYDVFGRRRALVRFKTPAGLTFRELRWADDLQRPRGLILSLTAAADRDDSEEFDRRQANFSGLGPETGSDRDDWSGVLFRAGRVGQPPSCSTMRHDEAGPAPRRGRGRAANDQGAAIRTAG